MAGSAAAIAVVAAGRDLALAVEQAIEHCAAALAVAAITWVWNGAYAPQRTERTVESLVNARRAVWANRSDAYQQRLLEGGATQAQVDTIRQCVIKNKAGQPARPFRVRSDQCTGQGGVVLASW
jgi:hypothetical protein